MSETAEIDAPQRDTRAARDFLAAQMGRFGGLTKRMDELARRATRLATPADEAAFWRDVGALADDLEALQSRGLSRRLRGMAGPAG